MSFDRKLNAYEADLTIVQRLVKLTERCWCFVLTLLRKADLHIITLHLSQQLSETLFKVKQHSVLFQQPTNMSMER